jgi:hypothetical protein
MKEVDFKLKLVDIFADIESIHNGCTVEFCPHRDRNDCGNHFCTKDCLWWVNYKIGVLK